jgi:hypothetical protein
MSSEISVIFVLNNQNWNQSLHVSITPQGQNLRMFFNGSQFITCDQREIYGKDNRHIFEQKTKLALYVYIRPLNNERGSNMELKSISKEKEVR